MNSGLTYADKIWAGIFRERGVKVTRKWAISEKEKCKKSYEYFIDNYCLIKFRADSEAVLPPGTKVYGDVADIKLYDIQRDYLRAVVENQNTVATKTRQSGISLTTGLFLLWRATFENNKEFIVISKSERESIKFLEELKFSQMHLPFFLRRNAQGNMKKLILGDQYSNSLIRALPGGKGTGRGYTATMLVLDEVAFIDYVEDIWTAAAPTLTTTGGKAVMISTPWEDEGLFYDVVEGARTGTNGFKLVEIPWESIPGRDEEWYARECAKLQHIDEKIKTELDMQFITRGMEFFSMDKIKKKPLKEIHAKIDNESVNPITTEYLAGVQELYSNVSIPLTGKGYVYEFPEKDSTYIIGHDPAEDGTSSCHGTVVFKVDGFPYTNPEIVLEHRSSSVVMDSLIDLSMFYNNAKVVVEKNRGYALIMHFVAADKEELIIRRPNGQHGIVTTTASRQILLKLLNKYFTTDVEEMPLLALEECKGFRRNSAGKLKGKKYDDVLFGAGIGLLGLNTMPEMILSLEDVSQDERLKLLENLRQVTDDKRISSTTATNYLNNLRKALFGGQSITNQRNDIQKYAHLLPV